MPHEAVKRVKSSTGEWEEILTNHVFDKQLTSKIYKELIRQQKKIFFNVKMSLKRLFQRHLDGQQVHLHIQYEVLNITNHQGNVNQNYNEIPPHTFRNGYYQKDNK